MGWRSNCGALFLLTLIFLSGSCYSEKAPYQTLLKDATSAPSVSDYDYIIISGGTAGCALAATLSEVATVLLLERGGSPYTNPNINSIKGFFPNLVNILPTSPAQIFVSTDGVINHRARVLGGGTAINAGFYSRASIEFLNQIGLDMKLVNESYEWVEKKVTFWPEVKSWQSAFRNGLLEARVTPYNGFTTEHINGTKIGRTIFDEQGHRHTAADLLEYAQVPNTFVYLNAIVQRILFVSRGQERARANGVMFKDTKGNMHTAYLKSGSKNEIILSAGAIGSPQLLMLSGVGPSQQLKALNIEVVVDQPMVGQGMADNPMNPILIPSPQPVEISLVEVAGITRTGNIIEGIGVSFGLDSILDLAKQLGITVDQNLQAILASLNLNSILNDGIMIEKVYKPLSTGHMVLQTNDPNDNPNVTFNYFKEPQDLQTCIEGVRTLINVIESKSFSKFRFPLIPTQSLISLMIALPLNLRPRRVTGILNLEHFCMDTVMTLWHYHGGCQVGKVVDHDYKVLGIDSLRVIDGSTFYDSPGTNPMATVMMIGRYMGQKILQDRYPSGRN